MFDFEKFGSTSTSNPTKPEEQKKGSTFNFDSFGSTPEVTTTPTNPVAGGVNVSGANQAPSEDTEPGFAKKAFDLFTSSEQGFGESIGQAINAPLYAKEAEQNNARYMKAGNDMLALAKKTLDPIKRETYFNMSQKYFDQAGRGIQDILGGEIKTTKQVLGEAAGTALDIATVGTYGAAAKTAVSGVKMAKPAVEAIPTVVSKLSSDGIKEAGKKVGIGTGIGYGYDVSFNLQTQEHADGVSILTPGFATLIGAGLPSLGFAYGAAKEVIKGKPLETVVKAGMEKGVKPSVAGKQTLGKIDEYHQKAADAVKSIVNYKDNLKFVDPVTGDEIVGELPKTLEQFGAAIEQTKKAIFNEYDALAKATGKQGNVVTFDSLLPELEKAANDTVLNLKDPHAAAYAADMAEKFKQLKQLTPEQAQQYITQMNADLQSFYRNPTYGTSSKVGIDVLIVNNMRKALDTVIESATGKEYQKLKSMYGSLKSIEKDVNHRAVVDARKNNATLVDYSNIFTYGDIAKGLISMDPSTVVKGVLGKGLQTFYKWRNDPNVLIKEMFEKGEKAIKNNVPSKPPVEIKSNKGFIDTMFPQEGKESPSAVKKTILDYAKSRGGMSIKDVSGGKAGYEGIEKDLVTIYRGQSEPKFSLEPRKGKAHNMAGVSFTTEKGLAEAYSLSGKGLYPTVIEGTIPKSKVMTFSDFSPRMRERFRKQISEMDDDDIISGELIENLMDEAVPTAKALGKEAVDMKGFTRGLVDEIRVIDSAPSFKLKSTVDRSDLLERFKAKSKIEELAKTKTLKGGANKKALIAIAGAGALASGVALANQKPKTITILNPQYYNEDGSEKEALQKIRNEVGEKTKTIVSEHNKKVNIAIDDRKEAIHTIFSEAGNNVDEYAAMYKSMKNRAEKLRKQTGKEYTLQEVLDIPMQYQGRTGNTLYERAKQGKLNVLEKKKISDIGKSIERNIDIGRHDSFGDLNTLKKYAPKAYESGDYKKVGSHYFFTMESNFKTK